MKTYIRQCPKCNCNIIYKHKCDFYTARKKGTGCTKCASNSGRFTKDSKHERKHPITWWKEKLTPEDAALKEKEWRKNVSIATTGKGNPMFGKPTPKGSGNGWSGWYKGHFFRSILELSFIINVLERFKFTWKTGECNTYRVPYKGWNGQERNYFPDFVINNKHVVECKPIRLHKSNTVLLKAKAAEEHFRKIGYSYRLIDCKRISASRLSALIQTGTVKLTDKYMKKYVNSIHSCGTSVLGEKYIS